MNMSFNRRHYLVFCLLASLAPAAHAHSGGLAIGIFLMMCSGALAVLVAAVLVAMIGVKGASGLKQLGVGIVIWLLAFALIFSLAMYIWQKRALSEREQTMARMQAEKDNAEPRQRYSDLQQVACKGDLNKVRAELAKKKHTRRDAIIAYEDCAVAQVNAEIAELLLKEFLVSDRSLNQTAHCVYLTPVFRQIGKKMQLDLLPLFTKRGLSLDCRDKSDEVRSPALPTWWKETGAERAMSDPLYAAYLGYLQSTGVDLNVDLGARNLLSYAFSYAHADTILMLMNEKTLAFKTTSNKVEWTPLQYWLLRRHGYVPPRLDSPLAIPKLSIKEIDKIQMQLPELSSNKIDFIKQDGQRFSDWEAMPDGGAALFRYLRQRGMTLHIPNQLSAGIFNGRTALSPEMIKELDQLNDVQLHEIACKKNLDGAIIDSLYTEAKMHKNLSMIDFLEKHNLSKC